MGFEGEGHSGPDALAGLDQLVLAQVLVVVASDIAGFEMAASAPTPREIGQISSLWAQISVP